jgi:hypothetical protein
MTPLLIAGTVFALLSVSVITMTILSIIKTNRAIEEMMEEVEQKKKTTKKTTKRK